MSERLSQFNQWIANAVGLVATNDTVTLSVQMLGRMLDLAREEGRKQWQAKDSAHD